MDWIERDEIIAMAANRLGPGNRDIFHWAKCIPSLAGRGFRECITDGGCGLVSVVKAMENDAEPIAQTSGRRVTGSNLEVVKLLCMSLGE